MGQYPSWPLELDGLRRWGRTFYQHRAEILARMKTMGGSHQERMTPLIAVMVLLVESMALAGLVAVEIQSRTAKAVVTSPASVGDLLSAKGLTGTVLAFSQAGLVLLLVATVNIVCSRALYYLALRRLQISHHAARSANRGESSA